jgi:hypothetical protein
VVAESATLRDEMLARRAELGLDEDIAADLAEDRRRGIA